MNRFSLIVIVFLLIVSAAIFLIPGQPGFNDDSLSMIQSQEREKTKASTRFDSLSTQESEQADVTNPSDAGLALDDQEPDTAEPEEYVPVTVMPENTSSLPDPGLSPLVDEDLNENTRSVAEAIRTGQHPERLSPIIAAPPFDEIAFEEDPQAYTSVIEPGRIYQSAQPGPGVDRIQITSSTFSSLLQGESVVFRVKVGAGDPVTFHSTEMGEFDNRLNTITVLADDQGVAETTFRTTPGMHGLVNVLAASPRTTGQAHFYVRVQLPEQIELETEASDLNQDG